jgi:hypothetical protein
MLDFTAKQLLNFNTLKPNRTVPLPTNNNSTKVGIQSLKLFFSFFLLEIPNALFWFTISGLGKCYIN